MIVTGKHAAFLETYFETAWLAAEPVNPLNLQEVKRLLESSAFEVKEKT